MHRHIRYKIVVLEEENLPLHWFPKCDILLSREVLNMRHIRTAIYDKDAKRKHKKRVEEVAHASTEEAFQEYGRPLEVVASFKYLGRVLNAYEDY